MPNQAMKEICRLMNGKWNEDLEGCELLLKNMEFSDDNLHITFDKNHTLIVGSWDSDADLPNYLNVSLDTPEYWRLRKEIMKHPRESPERAEITEKLRPYTRFSTLI